MCPALNRVNINSKENKEFYHGYLGINLKDTVRIVDYLKWIPARAVLYLMLFSGIAVTFMIRSAMNISILAMVKTKPVSELNNITEGVCYLKNNTTAVVVDYGGTLDWSVSTQHYVLTSFFWSYVVFQAFGGIMAQKFSTKKVFGWSVFVSSICQLSIPFSSNIHYAAAIVVQCINGLAQSSTWPAVYVMIKHWVPIQERSRFLTCFQGLAVGVTISSLITGFVISRLGWIYVFYIIGSIGVFFSLMWYLLIHDTPEEHPRVSHEELRYIQENRESNEKSSRKVPLFSILTSLPVWAIGVSSFGRMWMAFTLFLYLPMYFKNVIGLTVETNGTIVALLCLSNFVAGLIFSTISDKLVSRKTIPLIVNRRIFSGIGHILPGIIIMLITSLNCNVGLIVASLFFLEMCTTAIFSGSMANIIDISPNYVATVTSFVQFILLLPTGISSVVNKVILEDAVGINGWRTVFYVTGAIDISMFIFYVIFSSSDVQPWDDLSQSNDTQKTEQEMNTAINMETIKKSASENEEA